MIKQQNHTRKQQGNKTKQNIFSTAVELIHQKGFNNVSIDEICKAANVAKGTFYVHYKAKDDIIRESYYLDMGSFILDRFSTYERTHPQATLYQKIETFLFLEFYFVEYIGYELTCLAYSTNLSACIPGPSQHFKKRTFTIKLHNMLKQAVAENLFSSNYTTDELFLYLETSVRGMMATWCFANGSFSISRTGEKYIKTILAAYK